MAATFIFIAIAIGPPTAAPQALGTVSGNLMIADNTAATQPETVALLGSTLACPVGQRKGPTPPIATPRMFYEGEDTLVTVTSVVPPDPTLIPSSVTLLRVDSTGTVLKNLGQMYDDGTHGDAVGGDGQYTTQFIFNDPIAPGELTGRSTPVYLVVKASYSGSPSCRQSDFNERQILTGRPSTPEENQIVTNVLDAGAHEYVSLLAIGGKDAGNPVKARQDLINWLKAQPGVVGAGIGPDGVTVGVDFTSGFHGLIDTRDYNTLW
ncbi:MAG TPA: choice-of-anchor X domain-containing protein [Candidatus Binataceae bacterium]|nr:choice-of-anchor X domain-containing protein [Candidatus Binataceae bacterium]